jgi:hypothetical protein
MVEVERTGCQNVSPHQLPGRTCRYKPRSPARWSSGPPHLGMAPPAGFIPGSFTPNPAPPPRVLKLFAFRFRYANPEATLLLMFLSRQRQHGLKPHKTATHARLARAGPKAGGSQRLTCRTARAVLWRRPADQAVLARQACSSYSPFLCLAAPGLCLYIHTQTQTQAWCWCLYAFLGRWHRSETDCNV